MYLNLPPHTSVDANAFINVYEGLPVVLIRDITEVTAENLEKWRGEIYEKMQRGELRLEKMFFQYWANLILNSTAIDREPSTGPLIQA
eukprot:gene2578-biopygen2067